MSETMTERDWDRTTEFFADAIRRHASIDGRDPYSKAVESTVRVNTEAVPARGDRLLDHLRRRQGTSLEGLDVLEVGTGFGSLATYLAWKGRPRRLVGTDIDNQCLAAAAASLAASGLEGRVEFRYGDMRDLESVESDSFDLVVANGALIYLATIADLEAGLGEIGRVLRPGGWALFYHANQWRLREPFTRAPLVHLLPRRAADTLARRLGWRHNRDRVRLTGPLELARRLRRRGFTHVEVVGHGTFTYPFPPFSWLAGYYALSARLDGGSGVSSVGGDGG
jgi:SAM-dependent methyltransferase